MNSQELRALQEAYSQVYELDEKFSDDTKRRATRHIKDTKKLLRSMGTEIDDKYNPEPEGYEPKSDKKIKKKTQKEQVDLYDIILSHLLDEGYAETQEQAEAIMVNMSEDWRESIMERREHDEPGEDDRNPDVISHNRAVGYKSKPKQKYGSYDKRDRGGSEEDHEKSLGLQNLIRSVQGGSVKKSG